MKTQNQTRLKQSHFAVFTTVLRVLTSSSRLLSIITFFILIGHHYIVDPDFRTLTTKTT